MKETQNIHCPSASSTICVLALLHERNVVTLCIYKNIALAKVTWKVTWKISHASLIGSSGFWTVESERARNCSKHVMTRPFLLAEGGVWEMKSCAWCCPSTGYREATKGHPDQFQVVCKFYTKNTNLFKYIPSDYRDALKETAGNYRIAGNFGKVFNLANWRFCRKLLNLKLTNIISHTITLCGSTHDCQI